MKLYHFTSKEGFDGIQEDKAIDSSNGFITADAAYGHGQYLTDLEPNTNKASLEKTLWQTDGNNRHKTKYFFAFEIDTVALGISRIKEERDNVYLLKEDVIPDENLPIDCRYTLDEQVVIEGLGGQRCPE